MTYIDDISSAVVRVLTHACDGPPHRFAGYAANADFWVAEVRHCLDVIDGYEKRFRKLKAAVAGGWETPPPTHKSTIPSDRTAARRALRDAARRFLARCEKTQALSNEELIAYCRKLDVGMPL